MIRLTKKNLQDELGLAKMVAINDNIGVMGDNFKNPLVYKLHRLHDLLLLDGEEADSTESKFIEHRNLYTRWVVALLPQNFYVRQREPGTMLRIIWEDIHKEFTPQELFGLATDLTDIELLKYGPIPFISTKEVYDPNRVLPATYDYMKRLINSDLHENMTIRRIASYYGIGDGKNGVYYLWFDLPSVRKEKVSELLDHFIEYFV